MKTLWFAFMAFFALTGRAMSETADQAVDALFKDFTGPETPGASVMVVKGGKVLFSKGYGMADLEKKIPCAPDTNFRLASVSKQFTAMAVLILLERGQLSLDDRMTRFIPEFPEYGRDITVRHLLTHTSGLVDYEDVMPEGLKIPLNDRDVLWILRQQKRLYFAPGSEFRYSNSGYAVLALIVEAASGQTFPAFLQQHIFHPLGMSNTVAYLAGTSVVPKRAYGYALESDRWKFNDQSLTSAVLGDGGIYSSVDDLFRWDQALYTEKLVRRSTLDDAFAKHSSRSDFEGSGYGFGWYVGRHRDARLIWHYGSTCGFSTRLLRFPDRQLTFIILTNRRDTDLDALWPKLVELYW